MFEKEKNSPPSTWLNCCVLLWEGEDSFITNCKPLLQHHLYWRKNISRISLWSRMRMCRKASFYINISNYKILCSLFTYFSKENFPVVSHFNLLHIFNSALNLENFPFFLNLGLYSKKKAISNTVAKFSDLIKGQKM